MPKSIQQVRLALYLFGAFCAGYEIARFSEIVGQGPMLVHAAAQNTPVLVAQAR